MRSNVCLRVVSLAVALVVAVAPLVRAIDVPADDIAYLDGTGYSSKGQYGGIHQIVHLNDGLYGNSQSWIPAGSSTAPWDAGITLGQVYRIDAVALGRDNLGTYPDRVPGDFTIESQVGGVGFTPRHTETGRTDPLRVQYDFINPSTAGVINTFPADDVQVNITAMLVAGNPQPCIDEFEIYGRPTVVAGWDAVAKEGNLARRPGASAFASSYLNSTYNKVPAYLNDGQYHGSNAWICGSAGTQWAGIDLGPVAHVGAIAFGRDNTDWHKDRVLAAYDLQYTLDPSPATATQWATWGTLDRNYAPGDGLTVRPLFSGRMYYDLGDGFQATGIRLRVQSPASFGGYPAIDELEVVGRVLNVDLYETAGSYPSWNLATRPAATAFALNCIGGYTSHAIDHLNDGLYGNTNSWIGTSANSFAGIDLGGEFSINAIAFGRDNGGGPPERPEPYPDRWPGTYTLQYTTVGNPDETTLDADWVTIGMLTYDSAFPDSTQYLRHVWRFDDISGATGVRVITGTSGTCIDELEVFYIPEPATAALVGAGLLALLRRRKARR